MSEPNYNIDPLFDSEEEWLVCAVCQDDFIKYDKHCTTCEACVQQELDDNLEEEKENE